MSAWPWFRSKIAVDDALVGEILHQAQHTLGAGGHNVGGWRSGESFSSWPTARATLHQTAHELGTVPSKLRAWAVVHRDGSYHDWHQHDSVLRGEPRWASSGVLYLTTEGAATVFRHEGRVLYVWPVAGAVIGFPSVLEHRSEPHYGLPRVTVAFNVAR